MDAAQNKREGYVKVIYNVVFISLCVMCTKCVMIRCMDAAQNKGGGYVKVIYNVGFISLCVMCTKCVMIR